MYLRLKKTLIFFCNPNNHIGDFIKHQNPHLTLKAADAMALAIIYSTYLQLVFDEEGADIIPFDEVEQYIWAAHDKKTLH